ncbi:GNAT family N-acetyltransferase [Deinococcus alpinitundrae]|uniref:GNAT family N-acetyltransferase n=1 Tax=Deinococcus alpinitundrae TaxID=468913 RepID=UPI001379B9DB|nr:GNAT family N-acetyltransferase [Deinococcus alpinitundrae]
MSSPDPAATLRLEQFDPAAAPDATLRAAARFHETMRAERMPEDPPLDEAALIAGWRHPDAAAERCTFVLWDGDTVAASASLSLPRDHHTHTVSVNLGVIAPYRRRGLGKRLMRAAAEYAAHSGRRTVLTTADSRLPAGEVVLRRLGARLMMEQQFLQLDLAALQPQQLTNWLAEAEVSAEYRVWQNLGAYPAERLAEIARLHSVMNTAPSGERDPEDIQTTPEQLRTEETAMFARAAQRLTSFAEHRPSGRLVAFSELFWDAGRPTLAFQHATAVHPEHRRHSLGRWIKAANLRALPSANPQARFVRAGNTPDNLGMLSINHALGFQPYTTHTDWQLEVDALRASLLG